MGKAAHINKELTQKHNKLSNFNQSKKCVPVFEYQLDYLLSYNEKQPLH